jgi:hypothetical protein
MFDDDQYPIERLVLVMKSSGYHRLYRHWIPLSRAQYRSRGGLPGWRCPVGSVAGDLRWSEQGA